MTDMTATIHHKLKEIEQAKNVRILFAAESGSRAWGFPSPDADYDVRFIYMHSTQHYLRLDTPRDVIEWQNDGVLDINGWDLKKALRLLCKANPTLFEWNASPIVYLIREEWEAVRAVISQYFIAKAGLYHYFNMAQGNYRDYLKGDSVRLKNISTLYALYWRASGCWSIRHHHLCASQSWWRPYLNRKCGLLLTHCSSRK
jgi:hypothetical protein